ncbi:MAG TPA: PAS domain S-box protein [Nocardioides sp.]|nr:PAS domain S-box protein [Nocardioides sp.]
MAGGNWSAVGGIRDEARPSVALVDDSDEVRAVMSHLLESAGFDVVGEGGDGDAAISLASRYAPDLLLLDVSMPTADGVEVLPYILAISPETRVVVFTGFEEPGLEARARELGAVDFVEKSIHLEELPERLMRILAAPPGDASNPTRPRLVPAWTEHPAGHSAEQSAGTGVLDEHLQSFRDLFDRAEIGMATLTSSGTIVRANRALASLMSCRPYDLVGVDYGRLTVGQGDELDRRLGDIVVLGEDLTTFDHAVPAPAGQESSRTVKVTLAPVRDSRRQVLYVFAQVQDVTAQRALESDLQRSEANFRRLVTAVAEYAIFLLDVEGNVISWNSGAQLIKGYTASEIVGRNFRTFYTPEEQQTGHPEHNLQAALLEGSYAEEGWRVRKDGSRFWASVLITAVYDDAGRHVGYAKVTHDQTVYREHEEERRRFLEQRVHILAVTAHELRNPTAVIDGSAGALLAEWDTLPAEDRAELLYRIRSGADRLRRLAADLSTAARFTGDTLPQRIEDVSLTDALRSAAARAQTTGKDVGVESEIPEEVLFPADPIRLAQVLDNLIENALRHGRPPICVTGTVDDAVRIRVTDAGPGVPAELVPHLFERFAGSSASVGAGLGLYLAREIALRHGGDVSYHAPADGSPTAFEITLPRHALADAVPAGK